MAQTETKPTLLHRLAGFIGAAYLHFVGQTSVVQVVAHPATLEYRRKKKTLIYGFWHNTQAFLAYFHRRERVHVLVSQSKDGEYITQVMNRFGLVAVRGSTSRGGVAAFRKLCAALEKGHAGGFTPDGPRGPVQTIHPGIIAAAKITGAPIIPHSMAARRKLTFKSWDRFFVPLPFTSIVVTEGRPLWIGRDEDMATAANRVRAALNEATLDAESALRLAPGWWTSLAGWMLGKLYELLAVVAAPLSLLVFLARQGWRRTFKNIGERVNPAGIRASTGFRIWLHAASIGEWQALRPVLDELSTAGDLTFIITVSSPEARDVITREKPDIAVRMLPLDLPGVIRRWIEQVRPDAAVIVETELWPNLIAGLRRSLVPVFIINGRLSERSARRWRHLRAFSFRLLSWVSHFLVRTDLDGRRFCSIGAASSRVVVTGNTKVDNLKVMSPEERAERRTRLFGEGAGGVILLAGSTWPGEEESVLKALAVRGTSGLRVIIAPRRAARFDEVAKILEGLTFTWSRWSRVKSEHRWDTDVLLVDTMGDLKDLYGAADLAFVGGSLIPHGGQNPLEPAAAGVPVLFGPHMGNFHEEAEELKKAGAARQARHDADLVSDIAELAADGSLRRSLGESAARYVRSRQGAARQTADFLRSALLLENHRG